MTAVYKTASARNGENDTIQPDRLFTYSDRSLYQDEKNTHTSKSFFYRNAQIFVDYVQNLRLNVVYLLKMVISIDFDRPTAHEFHRISILSLYLFHICVRNGIRRRMGFETLSRLETLARFEMLSRYIWANMVIFGLDHLY